MTDSRTAELGRKAFLPTTHIKNDKGEQIAWDAIRERIHVQAGGKAGPTTLTVTEAAKEFSLNRQAIYARAIRHGWRTITNAEKIKLIKKTRNWSESAEDHRELAFRVGHDSVKKFKAKTPKTFRDLDIADRIARRAAGLDNAEVIQQTLVHINEAIEEHADVIEARILENHAIVDVVAESIEDTGESSSSDALACQEIEQIPAP